MGDRVLCRRHPNDEFMSFTCSNMISSHVFLFLSDSFSYSLQFRQRWWCFCSLVFRRNQIPTQQCLGTVRANFCSAQASTINESNVRLQTPFTFTRKFINPLRRRRWQQQWWRDGSSLDLTRSYDKRRTRPCHRYDSFNVAVHRKRL